MWAMPIDVGRLGTDLARLGVRPGDLLTIHASMRAIGSVDRGPTGVLDGIRSAIGPAGTTMMTMYGVDEPV